MITKVRIGASGLNESAIWIEINMADRNRISNLSMNDIDHQCIVYIQTIFNGLERELCGRRIQT